jgi:pimeloyl-ACP methyl ester carboxylesterase
MSSSTQDLPPLPLPDGISQSFIECIANGLTFHILEAGSTEKPLLLLLHGFPELAFSWRKIMLPLASTGYHVVAPDQRGYGRTTGWDDSEFSIVDLTQFTMTNLVRDMVVLVNALGCQEVSCVIGHNFGAVAASMCALMRPDMFRSVVTMSHPFAELAALPFDVRSPDFAPSRPKDIQRDLAALPEPRKHYKWDNSTSVAAQHWERPEQGLHAFLRGYMHLKSADWDGNKPHALKAWDAGELAKMPQYYVMPLQSSMPEVVSEQMKGEDIAKTISWMPEEDLNVYVQEWTRTAFQGGLNWYRSVIDPRTAKDTNLFCGKKIEVPAVFISGEKDWGNYQQPGALQNLTRSCSQFRGVRFIEGAGHWPQQEQPERVVQEILSFLRSP